MYKVLLVVLILSVSVSGYTKNSDRNKKGKYIMTGHIFPEVLNSNVPIVAAFNYNASGSFVVVDFSGLIYAAEIVNGKIKYQIIKNVKFLKPCKQYFFDKEKEIVYGFGTRDFHIVKLLENVHKEVVLSFNGNARIINAVSLKGETSQFLIEVDHVGWSISESYSTYNIYDVENDSIIFKSEKMTGGILYPIGSNKILYQKWNDTLPTEWYFCDNTLKETTRNKFIDKLNQLDISAWPFSMNYECGRMVGFIMSKSALVSICWKSDYSDFSVMPFTFHEPKGRSVRTVFEISPDGKWVKGGSIPDGGSDREEQILFYHVDNKYPSQLSLPIHGTSTNIDMKKTSVFVETKEYGPVYLDISRGIEGLVYMYKMNDVLWQITRRAKEMVE
jgi:hypothetical protein